MATHITMSDLLAQETKRNPYAFYAHLREQAPLSYVDNLQGLGGVWITTNYDDAIAILKDTRFTQDAQKALLSGDSKHDDTDNTFARQMIAWRRDMLTVDPPDHTRLRGLFSKAFTPRMIEHLRPHIQQVTNELLDAIQTQGKMDLVADFAFPLSITVISEMLGIPPEDRQPVRIWTQGLMTVSEKNTLGGTSITAMEAFITYNKMLISKKRVHPGDDLISALLHTHEQGDTLSENELISTIFLLIIAGHETTLNLISNGTLALLEHPEQMRLLQQDASLIPAALEELLRYTAPVSLCSLRWAKEDIALHGEVIRKGEMVLVSLIAANIDPQQFTNPETLDFTRQVHKHLAFGKGIHVCIGAPLARMEGQIAFSTLLKRLPDLRLAIEPEQLSWNPTPMRSLTRLPVTF